jgi:hypothetical protein
MRGCEDAKTLALPSFASSPQDLEHVYSRLYLRIYRADGASTLTAMPLS